MNPETVDQITSLTSAQFVYHVSGQSHAMAGAVIALSAAQAVALGQACMQISVNLEPSIDQGQDAILSSAGIADDHIKQMTEIKQELLHLCDQDAGAIAQYVALREAGETLAGQKLLCQSPADIGQLSLSAAAILQAFRPQVHERVQDDLEMSISLLAGTAQAAMLLLDSNLRIWPDQALLTQFEPTRQKLESGIKGLTIISRIRPQ